ncbi:putative chitinase 2 [Chionoecetes opilio]|uniref:Putative chitinase 2 n=1 Tax=Chionoecetes opilio TaxID=41210 RepID=A0A8J4Y906_CHIOP|nr:putative chitinase 2 [Chionoecetes opilio]
MTWVSLTEGVVMCYYESWAVYRPSYGRVTVSDLDPDLCTHYVYAYAGLDTNFRIKTLDPWGDLCEGGGLCGYDKFTGMKAHNPNLTTLLSVGGWNEGSATYSQMAASSANRAVFIYTALDLLHRHNFDGLDLAWAYPTQNGGAWEDKENLVILLKEMREALNPDGMVLTLSMPPNEAIVNQGYDIPGIVEHVDFVSVTTYNYHGSWDHYTHHHAGLYAFAEDTGDNLNLNVDASVTHLLEKSGMPPAQLVMGVATYGRCWTLNSADEQHGYYAPAFLPGDAGPWTGEKGFMAYAEICKKQQDEMWTVAVEFGCNEPFTYHMPSNRIWCSYDDQKSVAIKAQYAAEKGLAGVMVWSINDDDAHGVCHDRKFDLTWTMAETFNAATNN